MEKVGDVRGRACDLDWSALTRPRSVELSSPSQLASIYCAAAPAACLDPRLMLFITPTILHFHHIWWMATIFGRNRICKRLCKKYRHLISFIKPAFQILWTEILMWHFTELHQNRRDATQQDGDPFLSFLTAVFFVLGAQFRCSTRTDRMPRNLKRQMYMRLTVIDVVPSPWRLQASSCDPST